VGAIKGLIRPGFTLKRQRSRLSHDMTHEESPFDVIGGREVVFALAERFYDVMESKEPELTALHETDAEGRITPELRHRFALFLMGWLGGPQEYMERHGHPRLRMRHAHVPVNRAMRDAWMRCMIEALAATPMPDLVREFLEVRFFEVADFLRNVPEESD